MTIALLLGGASSALAQDVRLKPDTTGSDGCWPLTSRDRVIVQMDNGPARTGTLLCMGPEEIMLTGSGMLPLSSIRQISKPRDSYLDGVLKGAAVGLVFLVFCAPDCPGEYLMRATLGYATIGGIIDGLQGNNKTIYRREPKVAVGYTVRF
jgi:hypothetical protein